MTSTGPSRTARAWPLALVLSWSCAMVFDANASTPTTDEEAQPNALSSVHVELRTRGLTPKLTHQLAERLDDEIEARVAKLGLALETTPAADVIVQIEVSQPQGDMQLYVVQSVAVIDGEIAVRGEVQSCIDCGAEELMDRGLELLPDAAEALLVAKREVAEAQPPTVPAPTPPAPEVDPPRERLLGNMGYVGISVSGLGLGSSIAGAALLARADGHDETYVHIINYQPPGWALLGVGLAAMVAGNVLLAIDLRRSHHHRSRSSVVLTGIAPHISDAPGLLVAGRF
jgi:hypothetical protein